jgi:hypothetical protein
MKLIDEIREKWGTTQRENLKEKIILGYLHTDAIGKHKWTSKRIKNIKTQLKELEKFGYKIVLKKPIKYGHFMGYWALIQCRKKEENKTIEVEIQLSIHIEVWLDKNNLIEKDKRTFEETVGTWHTREMIFKEEINVYKLLDTINKAQTELGEEENRRLECNYKF